MSGLKLSGSLSITQNQPSDVTGMDETITLQHLQTNRLVNYDTQGFTYYIEVTDNLNSYTNFQGAGTSDNTDDAWGMDALSYNNSGSETVALNLPTRSGMEVAAGHVGYKLTSSGAETELTVRINLDLSNQGIITATAELDSFSEVSNTVDDDLTKAQHVYWPVDKASSGNQYGTSPPSAPSDSAADILSDSFVKADLDNHFSTELSSLAATYNNHNCVTSWALSISSVTQATNSEIAKYARDTTDLATGATKTPATGAGDVFITNDKLVAETPATYTISINDSDGTAQQIATGSVYGVVKHSA